MSRYSVNKVVRQLILSKDARARFLEDAGAYLQERGLTTEESQWLEELDYTKLYSIGAHPFLLWNFVALVARGDRNELRTRYIAAIKELGFRDYSTY